MNELARRIYEFNVTMGWHSSAPDLARYLMNLHSEVSELWEAWRENKTIGATRYASGHYAGAEADRVPTSDLCDKADRMREMGMRPLTCIEEELADIIIRTLDTAYTFGVDIDDAIATKMTYNATRAHRHGGKAA